ncbi:TPA: hypothetical protein L6A81_35530 [Pseudomonas aeruginosa]|uniref:hypothetical protein n=1 Tax=Pseudomonas aeruginosa TaxID=287 RepID=UPI000FFF2BB8|nr:hypothetical protein [Pseudomonas aeruginosa]MBG4604118.1 hypothetical protein [Pseudomonas aeruginosa]MBH8258124.1 hypothetical protein [Pseudomonas aeruginosa]NPS39626.1 hypothetical protein [Pseudomonas aeruginosa]NPS89098.1 hypothetical protein [Pseudomonas aeruginosa]HBN8359248.1 hypothetical protein [Pseudomonas aeruginosa]
MSRQGTKEQIRHLEDELARCKTNCRNHWAGKIVTHVGRIGLAAVVVAGAYFTIAELAGKNTQANIQVNANGSVSATAGTAEKAEPKGEEKASGFLLPGWINLFGLSFGAGGMLYGLYQARLRRDYIQLYAPLQAELERRHDPERTSSLLTERGSTRQEDL